MTNKNKELGKNAQIFSDHICAGLEAGGLDLDDYSMLIVTDKKEVGLLMAQVPLSEMCEEHTLESSEPIVCYEDRIEWPMEKEAALVLDINDEHLHQPVVCWEDHVSWPSEEYAAHLAINEQQPASKCAVLFLGAILTGGTLATPKCPECEE